MSIDQIGAVTGFTGRLHGLPEHALGRQSSGHRLAQHLREHLEAVLDLLEADSSLRDQLEYNAQYLRSGLQAIGFDIKPGNHPIIPVMVYDSVLAQGLSQRLLELGVYVVGFFFPVVPKGQARIRVQVSANHTKEQLDAALKAFAQAGKELGVTK